MSGYYDIVYLVHILFVGPLLIYIGYYKEKAPQQLFKLVLVVGLVAVLYHMYLFAQSMFFKSKLKII